MLCIDWRNKTKKRKGYNKSQLKNMYLQNINKDKRNAVTPIFLNKEEELLLEKEALKNLCNTERFTTYMNF